MSKGSPILTLRLSPEMIARLKIAAREDDTTVSDWLRVIITDALTARPGHTPKGYTEPIPGQITVTDLDA